MVKKIQFKQFAKRNINVKVFNISLNIVTGI